MFLFFSRNRSSNIYKVLLINFLCMWWRGKGGAGVGREESLDEWFEILARAGLIGWQDLLFSSSSPVFHHKIQVS